MEFGRYCPPRVVIGQHECKPFSRSFYVPKLALQLGALGRSKLPYCSMPSGTPLKALSQSRLVEVGRSKVTPNRVEDSRYASNIQHCITITVAEDFRRKAGQDIPVFAAGQRSALKTPNSGAHNRREVGRCEQAGRSRQIQLNTK
jgi:hypothetical protein